MRKNKNGYTLIELLASIAILAILVLFTAPALVKIKENALENSLRSKINLIENAAKEYGNNNLMSIPSNIVVTGNDVNKCINGNYSAAVTEVNCKKDCLIVVVRTLIEQGYLIGDDENKTKIVNPITNKSMNNELVCVRFDSKDALNRKMVSYVIGKNKWFEE